MSEEPTAVEVARTLADALEERGLPYAIGGAIALAYYAPPRATVDVDVNVFVSPAQRLREVLAALTKAGFVADGDEAGVRRQACEEGQFRGRLGALTVDVFVPAIDYYAEMAARRRSVPLLGRPAWILSPEDLVVLKLLFFRRKDLADVEAVLRDQGASLDRGFVRAKLAELVGAGDCRLMELDKIVSEVESEASR